MTQMPLALSSPDPRLLVRRSDTGGSRDAAIEQVESGKQAHGVCIATTMVMAHPGLTTAELAAKTKRIAKERFGLDPGAWLHLLGRRLKDAEDEGRGPIIGSEYRFQPKKPWRLVKPDQDRCHTTINAESKGRHAIRWHPRGENR